MRRMEFNNSPNRCFVKKMSEEIEVKVQGSPRDELVRTAVNFLMSPRVSQSPTSQKEAFLKKKGLTPEEIRIAFEKSSNQVISLPERYHPYLVDQKLSSSNGGLWFQKFKDVLHTILLIIGATYGIYHLFKKLIEPWLFGRGKKPKSLETSISDLNQSLEKSIGDLRTDMEKVQGELERVSALHTDNWNNSKLMGELKSEIATVKGILLSRHQFSSVNLSGPSIPAWQLTQSSHKDDKEGLENEDGEHNSGSSETEIVPNPNSNNGSQGSDSSLEMIKEVDN